MNILPVYVAIDEDGNPTLVKEEKDLQQYYQNVEDGTLLVLRFTGFTEEAQKISGKGGRVEAMVAESTTEDAPEQDQAGESGEPEDDGLEVEQEVEVQWAIDWNPL